LEKRWTKKLIRHAVSEFSKKGLGQDYYGYHNIDHELQATYFTLLSVNGHLLQCNKEVPFSNDDIKYLFVSSLLHDFDPTKKFDKPNEENVEWFLRSDSKIKKFIDIAGIDINVVIAIIYRTAYPFKGATADITAKRIYKLLLIKGLLKDCNNIYNNNNSNDAEHSKKIVEHYQRLGWFLSICERIAGYALGDFEYANKLARSNAHALGWHSSRINEESVKYFDSLLEQENEMLQFVLKGIPDNLKNNFFRNVKSFQNLYEGEKKIRKLINNNEISFICKVEEIKNDYNNYRNSKFDLDYEVRNCIVDIYHKTPIPLKLEESKFISTLSDPTTILITLRIKKDEGSSYIYNNNNQNSKEKKKLKRFVIELAEGIEEEEEDNRFVNNNIVGYVKGGPLEKYKLRRGTFDENYGKRNTAYMECICMKPGYLGSTGGGGGGHLLRMSFLQEAKNRGYSFVTGYVHRNVIMNRISKGEIIEIIQKYNPDKLDYYRLSLDIKPNIARTKTK